MNLSNHVLAEGATKVPACSLVKPKITTPAQWATCAKIGWNQPTTVAAHAGYAFGSSGAFLAVFCLVVLVAFLFGVRRLSGSGAVLGGSRLSSARTGHRVPGQPEAVSERRLRLRAYLK